MWLPLASAIMFLLAIGLGVLSGVSWEQVWVLGPMVFFLLVKRKAAGYLGLVFLLGILRVSLIGGAPAELPLGEWVTVEGEIVEEVDRRVDKQNLTVLSDFGRILVEVSVYEKVEYGEWVRVEGFLEFPEDGGYARYLQLHHMVGTLEAKQFEPIGGAELAAFGVLLDFKNVLQNRINHLYFEPEASFVSGLLLGSRKGMPEDLTLAFQRVGLTHIVAISGYNISLVIAAVFTVFGFLPVRRRVILSVAFIAVFVLLVGASAAVVRAALMGSFAMWGLYSGRKSQAVFALLWSAVGMSLWNPYILLYDIGFQLSFASTLGLLVWAPLFQKGFLVRLGGAGKFLMEAALLTLTAQVATFPFMVFYFGRISLVAPLANVLIAPFLPWAMLLSGLSLLCGEIAALVAQIPLKAVEEVALVFSQLSFADVALQFDVRAFSISLLLLTVGTLLFYKPILWRAFGLCRVPRSVGESALECETHATQ